VAGLEFQVLQLGAPQTIEKLPACNPLSIVMSPDERVGGQGFDYASVRRKKCLMKRSIDFGDCSPLFFFLRRHLCSLPRHRLPLAVAFEKGSGVQIICDRSFSIFDGRPYKTKSYDGGVAVLLYADVFGLIKRRCAVGIP